MRGSSPAQAIDTYAVGLDPVRSDELCRIPLGAHLLLEAPGGAVLHAVVVHAAGQPEEDVGDPGARVCSLVALRSGVVRQFQVTKAPPGLAVVRYPPPCSDPSPEERLQAVKRASAFTGQSAEQVCSTLLQAGATAEANVCETLVSYCVTGIARCWHITEEHSRRRSQGKVAQSAEEAPAAAALPAPLLPALVVQAGELDGTREPAKQLTAPSSSPRNESSPPAIKQEASSVPDALSSVIGEKAVATGVHLCLKSGAAAKVAGAAATFGCEGYALYQEVSAHSEKLEKGDMSNDQFQEKVSESTITSAGRAMGGLAGVAVGQAAIPVPLVGAVVGGVLGATCGGLHANSFATGMLRLTGGKARGGDDLVRCIEHKSPETENILPAQVRVGGTDDAPEDLL
mmetsp:Transcript_75314/g.140432  ORF Transcript_75314/g.140432 Transcript_75314/m.140432 type:complete len:400 (+) Transcript_75314:32-1231(+)